MKDSGHAAVEMAMAAGVLLLPVALVVSAFGPWSERRVIADSVAAEAARAAVLQLDTDRGADVVNRAMANYSLDQGTVRLGWCGAQPSVGFAGGCSMDRGSVVEAALELWTPLIQTPWGGVGGLWVKGYHSEPVDLYRSLD
ncbi:MAG: hypothetical protein U9N56_05905 [Actinomycetota bacterium]|nr:hypothetical protein [Actinomycetota bacterium]